MTATVTQLYPQGGPVPSISDKAILVSLTITRCKTGKIDKAATEEVNSRHGVDVKLGKYRKVLFSPDVMCRIDSAASGARAHHHEASLSWTDVGWRLLPIANYLNYCEKRREWHAEFLDSVEEMIGEYEAHWQARRGGGITTGVMHDPAACKFCATEKGLGGLFDPDDYPDPAELAEAFSFETKVRAMPKGSDFRVSLSEDEAAAIRGQIDREVDEAVADAMRDLWSRVGETVTQLSERLRAYVPAGPLEPVLDAAGNPVLDKNKRPKQKISSKAQNVFRDSLIENVRELVDVLPLLNVTGDAKLVEVIEAMRAELCMFDPEQLREDDEGREWVASKADAILAQIEERKS